MEWLPDLRVGTFEIRDLLGLVMTVVATYLAWLAIKMGREQDAVTAKQMELMAGHKDMLDRLADISSAQADATVSHEALVREMAESGLRIWVEVMDWTDEEGQGIAVFLKAKEVPAAVEIKEWSLFLPATIDERVTVEERDTGLLLSPKKVTALFGAGVPNSKGNEVEFSNTAPVKLMHYGEHMVAIVRLVDEGSTKDLFPVMYGIKTRFRRFDGRVAGVNYEFDYSGVAVDESS